MFFVGTVVLIVVVGLSISMLSRRASPVLLLTSGEPSLFDISTKCSGENMLYQAKLAGEIALAKDRRSVFDLQDGVMAVSLYALAESCYRAIDQPLKAQYFSSKGLILRTHLEEEYKLLRRRLNRALQADDDIVATKYITRLSLLLRHRQEHPYVLGLRRLSAELSSGAKF